MFYATIIDRDVFYVDETALDTTCAEAGWYVEWELSDGGYDIFGPFKTKEEAHIHA
jgi:hypothetical protein